MSRIPVSIIIPTLNRSELLARCLDSIERTVTFDHETICVTVEEDEATQSLLAGHPGAGVRNIVQHERVGYVKASNAGLRAGRGEYLLLLNDDCELLPHSVANAIRFLEAPAHSNIGLAAFFHDTPMRRNIFQQICVEGTWYFTCHVRGLCYANFGLAKRQLFERLDYYDERYFMYGADPDFSLKVWHEAKMIVAPCPGALVHHAESNDKRAAAERAAQEEDNQKLFKKWRIAREP